MQEEKKKFLEILDYLEKRLEAFWKKRLIYITRVLAGR